MSDWEIERMHDAEVAAESWRNQEPEYDPIQILVYEYMEYLKACNEDDSPAVIRKRLAARKVWIHNHLAHLGLLQEFDQLTAAMHEEIEQKD